MKLPTKGSNAYKLLVELYKRGPSKVSQIGFNIRGMTITHVESAVKYCSTAGLISHKGYVWELSPSVRRYFDGCDAYQEFRVTEVVPARTYNVYEAKPLSAKYRISANGNRPGSNDFKAWPSRHLEAA